MPPSKTTHICTARFSETGCPAGDRCMLRHDTLKCSCGVLLLRSAMRRHLTGKMHLKFIQQQEKKQQKNGPPEPPAPDEDQEEECSRCRRIVLLSEMAAHVSEHQRQDNVRRTMEELDKAEEDKEGIVVSHKEGIDFGVIEPAHAEGISVDITKTGGSGFVILVSYCARSSMRPDADASRVVFSATLIGKRGISAAKPRSVVVVFNPSLEGYYEDTLELVFAHPNRKKFIITRRIRGTAGSREDQEALKPKAPYKKRRYVPLVFDGPVIPSSRPPVWTPTTWVNILRKFNPPRDLIEAAYPKNDKSGSRKALKHFIPSTLNIDTYEKRFQALLYIEAEQKKRGLESYALMGAELKQVKHRYDVHVKGVADRRPSVLVGDYILARRTDDSQDTSWYQGRVHSIVHETLSLYFNNRFSNYRGSKYDIRFVYNRLPERRKHQAVTSPFKPMRLLFPEGRHVTYTRVTEAEIQEVHPFNRDLGTNPQQLETVAAIMKQTPGSVPFIIFGPPGTGKTVTIVEAMKQLLNDTNVRILACAPSNTAADVIAARLEALGKSRLFRLNSLSRKPRDLLSGVRQFSLLNNNEVFAFPSVEELKKYQVIVCTCISAGVLWGMGFQKGHFTHIFVDEAGQGEEPDVMIPFRTIADDSTNFILAGDHQQLGPIITSSIAQRHGLGKSYLLRLMERAIYDVNFGRGLTVVKLVNNFRSHPSILEFSNRHFYKSELRPCGNPIVTHSLQDIDDLPKKGFPIIFHGIVGRDQREDSSPSFFNIDEATLVKKYCLGLMSNRKKGIRADHIGVITPYHSQKGKILDLFYRDRDAKLRDIKVGSVDEFQGQERRIIILSTVRSNPNHVTLDMRRSLGFVASPLRLNVAMTRAQALLIVVGNPVVLSLDPLWRSFLNYVHTEGGWRGTSISWNSQDPVNLPSYDAQYRGRAEIELEDTLTRLKALVAQDLGQYDLDIDSEDDSNGVEDRGINREGE
ncbi:hypothetical protein AX17_004896 [Amanita inopinata Kibby_2008]|nr:hypothetical protein AX17_004896 [Amanita inopinata Kibby_2008]